MDDQQARIASQFLGYSRRRYHPSYPHPFVWQDRNGKIVELPSANDARWGAMIKAELQSRCLSFKIKWVLNVGWFCEIIGIGYTCIRLARTENLALMAAVMKVLEGEK